MRTRAPRISKDTTTRAGKQLRGDAWCLVHPRLTDIADTCFRVYSHMVGCTAIDQDRCPSRPHLHLGMIVLKSSGSLPEGGLRHHRFEYTPAGCRVIWGIGGAPTLATGQGPTTLPISSADDARLSFLVPQPKAALVWQLETSLSKSFSL